MLHRTTALPAWLAALLAAAIGAVVPVQSRINGELGAQLEDPVLAAAMSFGGGLVVMVAVALVLPRVRRGVLRLPGAVRRRELPPAYLLAGTIGALLVLTQSAVVAVVGVAVFTVAVVAGQTLSGLLTDAVGFAQDLRRRPTPQRLVGAGLVLVAVALAASSSFTGDRPWQELLLPALLPLVAGLLTGFQHAANARVGAVGGSPLTATVANFVAGSVALVVAALVRGRGLPDELPREWWLYTGGLYGIVFIAGSAAIVPRTGVLVLGLGSIAGQLIGSLALDLLAPVAGSAVSPTTVAGTLLALVAISLASFPRRRVRR
ncbi:DMT family transporter [Georgenia satyanarayanai]|uniref:DMT family transporter n=1 Tax=Georgenia satyanarayanai TaxID=860221 RepID=UPI00203E285B|nr:DMT family transporter [Georgenia satyanarayanai]MCM3659640.1 DMT family transporter [Georgenia satyanarayanai]